MQHRPDLKLLISSATLDAEKFSEYFDYAPIFKVRQAWEAWGCESAHCGPGSGPGSGVGSALGVGGGEAAGGSGRPDDMRLRPEAACQRHCSALASCRILYVGHHPPLPL